MVKKLSSVSSLSTVWGLCRFSPGEVKKMEWRKRERWQPKLTKPLDQSLIPSLVSLSPSLSHAQTQADMNGTEGNVKFMTHKNTEPPTDDLQKTRSRLRRCPYGDHLLRKKPGACWEHCYRYRAAFIFLLLPLRSCVSERKANITLAACLTKYVSQQIILCLKAARAHFPPRTCTCTCLDKHTVHMKPCKP